MLALIGSDGYLLAMTLLFTAGLGELIRRFITGDHHVSHRKLRAVVCMRPTTARRGSAVRTSSVEPQPAPGPSLPAHPGAGPERQATTPVQASFPDDGGLTQPSAGTSVPPKLVPAGSQLQGLADLGGVLEAGAPGPETGAPGRVSMPQSHETRDAA